MALYRNGAFVADAWQFPADDAALPAAGPVAVTKARFLAAREALLARKDNIGLVLSAGDDCAGIVADIARFALIVLRFPRYADGRPYSLARTLRDTHGFRGELRAAGNVLRDQVAFLLRAGFDALEISHSGTEAALREGRIVVVRRHYQLASPGRDEVPAPAVAWRRISRGGLRSD